MGQSPVWEGQTSDESEQGTLGKGRLHAHRGDHARERRSAGRRHSGSRKGSKVLDLGCGDGTTALPAARLGADVLGVDIAQQSGRGREPARAGSGPDELPVPGRRCLQSEGSRDESFDLVVSIFGAMFAPKPFDVAKEMVRVTRPGGRIVMGNWIPNDPTLVAQILKISSAYSPPPPEGFVSPMTWGIEANVIERFGAAGVPAEKISFVRDTYTFNFRPAVGVARRLQELLRADDERVRGGGTEWQGRGAPAGARGAVRAPEQEPGQGRHLDPGDVPARHRDALSSLTSTIRISTNQVEGAATTMELS